MRAHHPVQTDTPLQMMNSAVPATIQSAVEKRRKASIKGGRRVTFTFALAYATFSYRRLPAWEVGRCRIQVMRLAPGGLLPQARQVIQGAYTERAAGDVGKTVLASGKRATILSSVGHVTQPWGLGGAGRWRTTSGQSRFAGCRRSNGVRLHPAVKSDSELRYAPTRRIAVPHVRALVVDDHDVVREGLTLILERDCGVQVVGGASDGEEAVLATQRLRPDLIVMDLILPVSSGIDATRRVVREFPHAHIIVVSACQAPEHVFNALHAGARGYVPKASAAAELRDAVKAVMGGGRYVSVSITALYSGGGLATSFPPSPLERLSTREREVLGHIVAGSSSSAIASALSLSRKTVDTYRARMMLKLEVANRSALIRLALKYTLPSV
jgi:DNA-binding NarL/FixJ family response regulator